MSRIKTPEQHEAEYTWLSPAEVKDQIGVGSVEAVRALIKGGHLEAVDVSRSSAKRYKVPQRAIEKFLAESRRRVVAG